MRYLLAMITAFAFTANAAEVQLEDGTVVEITVVSETALDNKLTPVCSAYDTSGCEVGGLEYCTYYQDAEESDTTGYSFEDQYFRRSCDTNADGRYDFCLDYVPHVDGTYTFLDQSYYRYCAMNIEFNPTADRVLTD